jgi:hypothetical protein
MACLICDDVEEVADLAANVEAGLESKCPEAASPFSGIFEA